MVAHMVAIRQMELESNNNQQTLCAYFVKAAFVNP